MKKSESKGKGKIIENRNSKGEIISYRIRICVGREDGKQIWRTCTIPRPEGLTPKKAEDEVLRQADAWEQQQRQDFKHINDKTVDKNRITFHDFVKNHWMKDHVHDGDLTPSSIKFFEYNCEIILKYFDPKTKLIEVDTEAVKRFLNHLKKRKADTDTGKFSATTQKHVFGTLKNILGYAKRMHYLDYNPCSDLDRKEVPHRERKPIDFMRPSEARRFLECAESEPLYWKTMFHVLLKTGIRRGEACGLQWQDLSEKKLELAIRRNATLDKNSETGIAIGKTKTGVARTVPISQEVCNLLKQLKAEQENNFGTRLFPNAFIFCSEADPFKPIRPDSVTTKMRRFVEKNNLPNMSVHDLRHTAASLALAGGANPKQIQELLGHADVETTLRYYAEIEKETQRDTVQGLEKALAEKQA